MQFFTKQTTGTPDIDSLGVKSPDSETLVRSPTAAVRAGLENSTCPLSMMSALWHRTSVNSRFSLYNLLKSKYLWPCRTSLNFKNFQALYSRLGHMWDTKFCNRRSGGFSLGTPGVR